MSKKVDVYMEKAIKNLSVKKGIFYLNRRPLFLLTADYPYYRDSAGNWEDRLRKLKEAGINIITAYIPWRHHVLKDVRGTVFQDFSGTTQDNRNLREFVKLSRQMGMYLILKPGPFIHAEVNFGGLPDWVSPETDKSIHPMVDCHENPYVWTGKILPSPLDEKFSNLVLDWFSKVDKEIFSQIAYPKGNLIGIQIANEGIYSNAPDRFSKSDYSPPALKLYEKFLKQKYPYIKNTSAPKNTADLDTKEKILKLMSWSDFQSFYYKSVLADWKEAVKTKVPFMVNINPPHKDGSDSWLSRNIPEEIEKLGISYGYTDWIGILQEDETVRGRYLILTRRARGFNLEDNWGFSNLYDARYKYPEVSFYQSLFTIACGAKGFNVYTGISTAHWDADLDNQSKIPYPATAPVNERGDTGDKYKVLKLISGFFGEHGEHFLESFLYAPFSWGLYLPYAHICGWFKDKEGLADLKLKELSCADALTEFANGLYARNFSFDVLNLVAASQKLLNSKKVIVFEGGFFMDEKTQTKLSNYVGNGGVLIVNGQLPQLNGHFKNCNILKRRLQKQEKGKLLVVSKKNEDLIKVVMDELRPDNKVFSMHKDLRLFLYEHPQKNMQFLFVFNEAAQERFVEVEVKGRRIGLNMAKKSASLLKIEDEALKAVLIKARSELYQSRIIPKFTMGNETFELKEEADLYASKEAGAWKIYSVAS